jgi:hypothetical protein
MQWAFTIVIIALYVANAAWLAWLGNLWAAGYWLCAAGISICAMKDSHNDIFNCNPEGESEMTKIEMTAQERCDAEDNYFGGCPECGGSDGCINIGPNHWYYCKEHRTRWCIGSNLFSSWKDQTKAEQLEAAARHAWVRV